MAEEGSKNGQGLSLVCAGLDGDFRNGRGRSICGRVYLVVADLQVERKESCVRREEEREEEDVEESLQR